LPALEALRKRYRIALVSNIDDDLLQSIPFEFDLVCTAERAKGYKPDGTLFRYLLEQSGLHVDEILQSGQSQFNDFVGAKPLGLTVAWINRRGLRLSPDVPPPDHILADIASLPGVSRMYIERAIAIAENTHTYLPTTTRAMRLCSPTTSIRPLVVPSAFQYRN